MEVTADATAAGDGFNDDANDKKPFAKDAIDESRKEAGSDGSRRPARRVLYIPKRLIVTVLLGMGMLLVYAMRTNVGTLVVIILDMQALDKLESVDVILNVPPVRWDARQVGWLHSVFYVGFMVTQIPAAFGTMMWPSHRLFGGCILVSALFNLLLPVCVEYDQYALTCIIRTCQGLAEGCLYPACYGVLRHWAAPSERSRMVSAVLSCCYAGAIVGFPIAGAITHYQSWQYIFYFFGGLCILWWFLWAFFAYEKPSHHADISDSEFEFMTQSQGDDIIDYENVKIPWKSILTSLPVAAICLCHFVRQWILSLMLTNEPLYLSKFGFNIAEAGALASLPHVAKMVMSVVSGIVADLLLNKKYLTTTVVRKILVGVGFGLECVGFLVLTALSGGLAVIIVLTMSIGAFGLTTSGWSVNHYDLSTRYASVLVAVTSTFGTIGAILVPIAIGHLTVKQDLAGWANVFYLTAGIILLATIFFLIFGSGEAQRWSNPPANFCLIQKIDPLARKPYKALQVQNCQPCKTGYTPVGKNTTVIARQSDTILQPVANGDGTADKKGNDVSNHEANDVDDSGNMEVILISKDSINDELELESSFVVKGHQSKVAVDGEVKPEPGPIMDQSKSYNSEEVKCFMVNSEANSDDTGSESPLHASEGQPYSKANTSVVDDISALASVCHQSEKCSTLQGSIGDKPPVKITGQFHHPLEHCSENKDGTKQSVKDEGTDTPDSDTNIGQYNEAMQDMGLKNGPKKGESKTESLALQTEIDFALNEHLID